MDVYKYFCEVATFNSKYLINKYDMTFNTFVGVNNHSHVLSIVVMFVEWG
jgi:hypothetical protein